MGRQYFFKLILIVCLALSCRLSSHAQELLEKTVSVDCKKKPLGDVLTAIGKQGNFYFSYNALMLKKDSLVTITVRNKTVQQTMVQLLGDNYQFKETENHIIILPADREKWYTISGHLNDGITGLGIPDASIFERQQLASTLTDGSGYFRLRIKDKGTTTFANITVSKGFYNDTTIALDKGYDQEVNINLSPAEHALPDVMITQYSQVEQSWIGRVLFSNRLRKQSANLGKFFVEKPISFSFTPGLGSHGKMSGQVTNTFSFNVLGGYAAGVNGFELGGIFNIDKKDVKYAQVGGAFNIVAGGVTGCQVGGVVNTVSKSVKGIQVSGVVSHVGDSVNGVVIAGVSSSVRGSVRGVQIAGITNVIINKNHRAHKSDTLPDAMHGAQAAGIANVVNGNVQGCQAAGIINLTRGNVHGVQASSIVNIAHKVEGSQISIINIADTVTGYCFGIINIVRHGYHKLSLSSNEMLELNATYKAGTGRLYSILGGGATSSESNRVFGVYYGVGTEIPLAKWLSIATELTSTHVYPSSREDNLVFIRLEPALNVKVSRMLSIFAGPSVAFCPATQGILTDYFPSTVPVNAIHDFKPGDNMAAWLGWKVGVNLF